MRTLLLIVLLLASRAAFAQVARPWPHNTATGKIEFTGQLPWPDSVRTEMQRQRLVRHWYRQKLTNDKPETIRQFIQETGVTYAGIPRESCYRIRIMNADNEIFSLCFTLLLTPNTTGLKYNFSNFECAHFSYDAVNGDSLENALNVKDAHIELIMGDFRNQMLGAAKAW